MPNIKIRTMHNSVSTLGVFLEDGGNYLCPQLRPGEVVEVPDDHPIFASRAAVHIEITRDKATRPYQFDTLHQAMAQSMSEDDALEAAGMIGTSLEMSAKIREENFNALQRAKAEGVQIPPEPSYPSGAGLEPARDDNAVPIGSIGKQADAQAAPKPRGKSRRRAAR